jgi:hypothetical protein
VWELACQRWRQCRHLRHRIGFQLTADATGAAGCPGGKTNLWELACQRWRQRRHRRPSILPCARQHLSQTVLA